MQLLAKPTLCKTKRRTQSCPGFGASLFMAGLMSVSLPASSAAEQKANPELVERMEIFEPRLQKAGKRVHAVIGYEYSNYSYIEGDDGIIVVDSGFFSAQAERSLADYRKLVPNKPIAAIIYTHLHIDHTGGATGLMLGQNADIPVYGPKNWQRWIDESFSNLRPAIFRRIFMQMGMVLPRGENGTVGNGLNPSPIVEGSSRLDFPPTVDVSEMQEVTIAGVRIQLIPTQGDIPENLYVWLPDDEVLFVGDIPLHATFPALETVRFEADRDPRELVGSLDRILELNPEFVVPGHGRVLDGRADIADVTLANRDTVEFLIDQVDRYYANGYSADQMIDAIKLPPALEQHPDLQPHYHRVEWMIKTMFFKRAGFVEESMDYLTLTNNKEAQRLVPLLGGAEKVRQSAKEALDKDDPRWAARLATYALEVDKDDAEALKIRQQAYLKVAQTTVSANERNYLLSTIREENGELDWKKIFAPGDYEIIKIQNTEKILKLMKSRFMAEAADGVELVAKLKVAGADAGFFTVRNNVLLYSESAAEKVDSTLSFSRDTLDRIAANMTSWSAESANGSIKVKGGKKAAKQLFSLIE